MRRHRPLLPAISDNSHRFFVVAHQRADLSSAPWWLEADFLTDAELQHFAMIMQRLQKSQPLHDAMVELGQFFFAELVNIDFHAASFEHHANSSDVIAHGSNCSMASILWADGKSVKSRRK